MSKKKKAEYRISEDGRLIERTGEPAVQRTGKRHRHPKHTVTEQNIWDEEAPVRERPATPKEHRDRVAKKRSRALSAVKKRVKQQAERTAFSHAGRLFKDGHRMPINFDILYECEVDGHPYSTRDRWTVTNAEVMRQLDKLDEPEMTHENSILRGFFGRDSNKRNRSIPPDFTVRMTDEPVQGYG